MTVKSKKCYYSNMSKFIVFYFYSSLMFGVADGTIGISDVSKLLQNPDQEWPKRLKLASTNGLYLIKVKYHPDLLRESSDNLTNLPIEIFPENEGLIKPEYLNLRPIEYDKMDQVICNLNVCQKRLDELKLEKINRLYKKIAKLRF